MFAILSNFFQNHKIEYQKSIPMEACRIRKPYLLEREGFTNLHGTAIIFAVPYLTPHCDVKERNISAYAVSRDYHAYFDSLFAELLPLLKNAFPKAHFAGFADHSPIDEVDAAVRAGIGVLGKNGLLLTEKYSSFVFIGEIFTDLILPSDTQKITECEGCGACTRVCPAKNGLPCLSALTQKKGTLTREEAELLRSHATVWGCDLCQNVCPHTARALKSGTIYTEIPYFYEYPIPYLTTDTLESMSDAEFSKRAYAWRRRETVYRNLLLFEKGEPPC